MKKTTTKPRVMGLASDPGAARAILPVLEGLMDNNRVDLTLRAYDWAFSSWSKMGLDVRVVKDDISIEEIKDIFIHNGISMLLSGTSHRRDAAEKRFIAAARAAGIPSLVILDFWSNYSVRFSSPSGNLNCLPDKIAVMDEHAVHDLSSLGISTDRLAITGQPAFDGLARVQKQENPYLIVAIRDGLEIKANEIFILFVSQPLADYYNLDSNMPDFLGFDEHYVVHEMLKALDMISRIHKTPIRLILRPHPRENYEWMRNIKAKNVKVQILPDGNGRYLAQAANLVVGMNSSLLVEACYLGALVASLQPGLNIADPLPTNRFGFSRGVYQQSEIQPVLESMLFNPVVQKEMKTRLENLALDGCSTQRVVDLVYQMTGLA